ncbi:MAG: dephospho-CoA kinase, partial [Bacteroidetes bacterium]|nr:dephospho-CoA kinase [Bacteroidota bacterium]
KGYPVFNSDHRAKELMVSDKKLKDSIESLLGIESYLIDEHRGLQLNNEFISSRIFTRSELKIQLEQLVHPAVRKDFEHWALAQKSNLVFQESALILATEYYQHFDAIVLISAPLEMRIERILKRDGLDRYSVLARINAQPDFESLLGRVTHLIDNSEKSSLEDQVDALISDLLDHSE